MGRTPAALQSPTKAARTMARTAWLIDGMAYVFRSFYGMRPMAAPDGTPINAVFGLGMTLQKLLVERKPELLACCFDAGAHTFRNELYPAYKANRGEPPAGPDPPVRHLPRAGGAHGHRHRDGAGLRGGRPDRDADDAAAGRGARGGHRLGRQGPGAAAWGRACASTTWRGTCGGTPTTCPARMGVRAEQVVDLLALTGDAVDNIPGVRGVGPKAAAALLAGVRGPGGHLCRPGWRGDAAHPRRPRLAREARGRAARTPG